MPDKFARISRRLATPGDRTELGQLMPLLGAALRADDLEQIVAALGAERIIVAVPVETHPDAAQGEHSPVDLTGQVPLPTVESPAGPAIEIFASAAALTQADPQARPHPLSTAKAALTASAAGAPRLWLHAGDGSTPRVIPRSAVEAIAVGAPWLPPWKDTELREDLETIVARETDGHGVIVTIDLEPGDHGSLIVNLVVGGSPDRKVLTRILAALGQSERLKVAAEQVEVRPRLLPTV